jgi:hypothetical protein
MAKIYDPPQEMETPDFTYDKNGHPDIKKYEEDNEKYIEELKVLLLKRKNISAGTWSGPEKYVGEIIRFPVADGHAEYMVASMKPLELVHLPLSDAWYAAYVHLLTAKEVTEKIECDKKMKELFQ